MKLSLAIIADKLKRYEPELNQVHTGMVLTGARMLTAVDRIRQDILYVVPAGECFERSRFEKRVLCIQGRNWMVLRTNDAAEALGAILDIFEAFDKWEADLHDAVSRGCDMQHFIDISRYALPFPMFITDLFDNVIGYTKTYGIGDVDARWDGMVRHLMPVGHNVMDSVDDAWAALLHKSEAPHRERSTIELQLAQGSEYVGAVTVIEHDNPLTEGVEQLADILRNAASEALILRGTDAELRTMVSVARDHFDGKLVDTDSLWERICEAAEWENSDMELILLQSLGRTDNSFKNGLAQKLAASGIPCFCLPYHEFVVAILRCNNETEFLSLVRGTLAGYLYRCGVSLPFSRKDKLRNALTQARLALTSGNPDAGTVSKCVDHAYDYFLDLLSDDHSAATGLIHPALELLQKYDRQHQTELYRTLYTYLRLERNVVATAKSLFIHRNSMLYRLQRIEQLLGLDFDDVNLRMYLMLSYQIEATKDKRTDLYEPEERESAEL